MYIKRKLSSKLVDIAKTFPVIAILGPRQSGKTTLSKHVFKNHNYVSLENFDMRELAIADPKGFIKIHKNKHGIILDEIQHAPNLLSYIQTYVDENPEPGGFVLTGSQNFVIHEKISQTLAGRIFISTLLPFTIEELQDSMILPTDIDELIFTGLYPRIFSQKINPIDWYPSYISTYVERDVRQIKNVSDLQLFQKFFKLCAGRIGQLLDITSLSNDVGVSVNTIKSWISILEASYIIFLLYPHFNNYSKRIIKTPKLYFYDTGVACSLLGIESVNQIMTHYLKGNLFESLIISELKKKRFNVGLPPRIYFYRDNQKNEIDCIFEKENKIIPIEIKSGHTINSSYFDNLIFWNKMTKSQDLSYLIYAGSENHKKNNIDIISWKKISSILN